MSDVSGEGTSADLPEPTSQDAKPAPAAKPAAGGAARRSAPARKPAPRTSKPRADEGDAADGVRPSSGAARAAARTPGTRAPRAAAGARPAAAKSAKPATPAAQKPASTRRPAAAAKALVTKSLTGPQPVAPAEALAAAETVEAPQAVVEEVIVEEVIADEIVADAPEPVEASPESSKRSAPAASVGQAVAAKGAPDAEPVLVLEGLTKRFGAHVAVDGVTLSLDPGTFTGIVGPNGAGKTTTLSMITGLLRPTEGRVLVAGVDVWRHPQRAKRQLGVLPDRLHTFDRLTGGQLLYYTGVLHGLDRPTARRRTNELAEAFKVEHAMGRLVTDYSSGMLKKIALAAALIHAPRLLVLDEPFESVDPVSAMTVAQILRDFAAAGGTVLLSSHSMELVQRICDHVAVIVDGRLIAGGTVDEVRGDRSLQERFIDLAGADAESIADLTWLHRFSG